MSVWDYIRSLQCMDFETFQNLVDTNCDVTYVFNGELGRCTGAEFVTRLKKGHFENTKKMRYDSNVRGKNSAATTRTTRCNFV